MQLGPSRVRVLFLNLWFLGKVIKLEVLWQIWYDIIKLILPCFFSQGVYLKVHWPWLPMFSYRCSYFTCNSAWLHVEWGKEICQRRRNKGRIKSGGVYREYLDSLCRFLHLILFNPQVYLISLSFKCDIHTGVTINSNTISSLSIYVQKWKKKGI